MRPLLMVHGISSYARETFGVPEGIFKKPRKNSMYLYLQSLGYQPGKDLFWYTYWTYHPVPVLARRLHHELEKVKTISGNREIDILTFSLGGIISKYYLISPLYQDHQIKKLIMIAPPFLGSRWADWYKYAFTPSEKDMLFPGDGRALTPNVLSFKSPFLNALAKTPFPEEVETTIIAMKALTENINKPISQYVNWLTGWIGEGDTIVPVESTKVPVQHYYEIVEEFSLKAFHKYLPYHPRVQELVAKELL